MRGPQRTIDVRRLMAVGLVVALAAPAFACGSRVRDEAIDEDGGAGSDGTAAPTTPADSGATEVGVTADEIRLGLIVSRTSPLGSETFSGPMYGALAYFSSLNERGGIDGRTVEVVVCDDNATGAGNRRCARELVEDERVMAFVANSIFNYSAASYIDDRGVPDIGGQPISNAYQQYGHLWSIYGTSSPRDGEIGVDGRLDNGTDVYRHFKETYGVGTAGVVYYNQADSLRYADLSASALELEGYTVVREQVDFAVPNFDAAAIDMRNRGVDIVFDALDSTGNVRLCAAMEAAELTVEAKVVTVQSWNESLRTDYSGTPTCRDSIHATAETRNYNDTNFDTVRQFRDDMATYHSDREDKLSMWTLEGWAAAQWFTDAATSCGTELTRACIESYLARPEPYDGQGLLVPRDFVTSTELGGMRRNCLNVARWQDSAGGGAGAWVTTTPDGDFVCYDVPAVVYTP